MSVHFFKSPPTRVVWIEIECLYIRVFLDASPPTRVVWIEIYSGFDYEEAKKASPPTRVVWIEIILE